MKSTRQQEILDIIAAQEIETQEQLLERLKARGISTTQATISRDIKQLHLVKELTAGGSINTPSLTTRQRPTSPAGCGRSLGRA